MSEERRQEGVKQTARASGKDRTTPDRSQSWQPERACWVKETLTEGALGKNRTVTQRSRTTETDA